MEPTVTNMSHLGKRKIIDSKVPWEGICSQEGIWKTYAIQFSNHLDFPLINLQNVFLKTFSPCLTPFSKQNIFALRNPSFSLGPFEYTFFSASSFPKNVENVAKLLHDERTRSSPAGCGVRWGVIWKKSCTMPKRRWALALMMLQPSVRRSDRKEWNSRLRDISKTCKPKKHQQNKRPF